jgi:hypothetical protein
MMKAWCSAGSLCFLTAASWGFAVAAAETAAVTAPTPQVAAAAEAARAAETGIVNVVRYSAKTVTYEPATRTLAVVGTDLPQDDRILIFDNRGTTYTLKGPAGAAVVRDLDGGSGNHYLCLDRTKLPENTFGIQDFFFKAAPGPNDIVCGRLIWNTAMNSAVVSLASAAAPAASRAVLPAQRPGAGALFMAGKLPAERQVFKLAVYGDSIYASGFKDIPVPDANGLGRYEQPPRSTNLDGIQRYIYDYLNFNKPTFRNALHTDWTKSGLAEACASAVMPNGNAGGVGEVTQWEQLWRMHDAAAGNTAEISITGSATLVIVFEGGAVGTDAETGDVSVAVSVKGGDFVNPSTVLSGKLTAKGFADKKVYAPAPDTFTTSFSLPTGVGPNDYNKRAPMVELYYNGLDPATTYRFRITKAAAEARPVTLWGLYHFSGQTLLVTNESKPGFSWGWLATTCYGDLVVSGTDFVLIEAPMYHDNYQDEASVMAAGRSLLDKLRGYGMQIALCSCPPGGVIPAGRATSILGDENGSAYRPGQHFMKYFDYFYRLITTDIPSAGESPAYGDVYTAEAGGKTWQFTCVNSDSPLPTGYTYFQAAADFEGFGSLPVTLTRVSGKGKAEIAYSQAQHGRSMSQHRDAMQRLALTDGYAFVDIYQAFVDVANAVGEDLYTDGYDMDPGHPLYATVKAMDADDAHYPSLTAPYKMNYMTNFFDIGDGHHLANPAHSVIFEAVKNTLLRTSAFKE